MSAADSVAWEAKQYVQHDFVRDEVLAMADAAAPMTVREPLLARVKAVA
jgi:hypothetical protein